MSIIEVGVAVTVTKTWDLIIELVSLKTDVIL